MRDPETLFIFGAPETNEPVASGPQPVTDPTPRPESEIPGGEQLPPSAHFDSAPQPSRPHPEPGNIITPTSHNEGEQ